MATRHKQHKQLKGFMKFPFAWREPVQELGRINPTAAYVWMQMWWRSNEHGIFDLEEGLFCGDLGLNRKTLCSARSLIAKHGGFKRIYERNAKGQLLVKYQMSVPKGEEQIPNNGICEGENKSQDSGLEPEPNLRYPVKRDYTVDTLTVTASATRTPIHETPVDTNQVSKEVSKEEFASLTPVPCDQEDQSVPNTYSVRLARKLDSDEWFHADSMYRDLFQINPMDHVDDQAILAFAEVCISMQERYRWVPSGDGDNGDTDRWLHPVQDFHLWNKTHKATKPGYVFTNGDHMARVWFSDDPHSGRWQWEQHDGACCPICTRLKLKISGPPDRYGAGVLQSGGMVNG